MRFARDTYDRICWVMLVAILLAMAGILFREGSQAIGSGRPTVSNKALERELAYRARIELIAKLYAPVETLRTEGNPQGALLKLDELTKKYPGEAHGFILQGEILQGMGVLDEAVSSYVAGLKLNGDYVDSRSPLSRRDQIQRLVDDGLKSVNQRTAASPDNRSLAAVRQKINYLRSRLAGGCE